MKDVGSQRGWAFRLLWVGANTIAWGTRTGVSWAVGTAVQWSYLTIARARGTGQTSADGYLYLVTLVVFGVLYGAIIGIAQQLVLRRQREFRGIRWVFATLIGILLQLAIGSLAPLFGQYLGLSSDYARLAPIALTGTLGLVSLLALGTSQWFVLRGFVRRSGWWIAATAIALWVSNLVTGYGGTILETILSDLVYGLAYGLVTEVALSAILKKSRQLEAQSHGAGDL